MIEGLRKGLPLFLWTFLIFFGSSLPPAQASDNGLIDFAVHKLAHLLEYGILYLLYYKSVVGNIWEKRPDKIFQALLFVAVFGAADEYHQSFVPGRSPRVADVIIDFLGGLSGLFVWWSLRRLAQKKQKN
jgi:VanZ family protein